MSSTRLAPPNSPLAFERYMSSPEFAALRPIPISAVLAKAMLYRSLSDREMAFFLQAMSMQDGGLRAVSEQLVAWYPERCREGSSQDAFLLQFCELSSHSEKSKYSLQNRTAALLADDLVELAINPGRSLSSIRTDCFEGLDEALRRYKKEYADSAFDGFVLTSAGAAIHETLDKALASSRMVVIEGTAGAGKSTNARVWCASRLDRARYVSLTGITNRSTLFQKIGAAIGLGTSQRSAQQNQVRIEDFFARSKMMLVIDEAHYLWPQGLRRLPVPELVDWVNTALVNCGVPVALLCTDQFARLKNRVERSSGWTSEQFIHRVYRYKKLDSRPSDEDVIGVAKSLLSAVWNSDLQRWIPGAFECPSVMLDALAKYALEQTMPLSCVASCIQEARGFAIAAGRLMVGKGDVGRALGSGQIPSDAALSRAFAAVPSEGKGRAKKVLTVVDKKPVKAFISTSPQSRPNRVGPCVSEQMSVGSSVRGEVLTG